MGFLDRMFRKSKAPAASAGDGGAASLAATLAQQQESLAPRPCDACGATYLSSEAQVCLLSARAPTMQLDIGGYCPRCGKQLCQRHLKYDHVVARHLPEPEKIRNASYGIVCARCGTQVRHERGAEPASFVTVVAIDAKDLEPKRAKPSPQVAAPSGKFSLHKIVLMLTKPADSELAPVPTMICTKCFAPHPHPVPAPVLGFAAFAKMGYEVGPEDFEVDIGGNCPTCGVLCGKHIVLKEVTVEGAKCLGLHCATHGELLR